MALFLIILFIATGIFLVCYKLFLKRKKKKSGRPRKKPGNILFKTAKVGRASLEPSQAEAVSASSGASVNKKWNDWRYRVWVEINRKAIINAEEAAKIGGVSLIKAEKYLDKLESEGKIQQAGDSDRGIFYKVISS